MSHLDLTIKNNYGKYNTIPVCNTIKKILIGKVFTFCGKRPIIIIGVRRNNLYGHLEILIGDYHGYSINVCSWYAYQRNNMTFVGRGSKRAIKNCLKRNSSYIHYHIGKQLTGKELVALRIYDNCNYYNDYIENEIALTRNRNL